jgi:hypothetical protein
VADRVLRQLGGRAEHAWSRLSFERRLAAGAAFGLLLSLFLPWFQETVLSAKVAIPVSATISGWGAFSLFEAVVLVVAIGTLVLLFQRAEGRRFQVPGGDGGSLLWAGVIASVFIVLRMFDKETLSVSGPGITTAGVDWGIFVALGAAVLLAYAGWRLRSGQERPPSDPLHVPDPPEVRAQRRRDPKSASTVSGEQLAIPLDRDA